MAVEVAVVAAVERKDPPVIKPVAVILVAPVMSPPVPDTTTVVAVTMPLKNPAPLTLNLAPLWALVYPILTSPPRGFSEIGCAALVV